MNRELQRAQDMLTAMQAQRDNALNVVVMNQAEITDLRRELASAQAEITRLTQKTIEEKKADADVWSAAGHQHPGVPVSG